MKWHKIFVNPWVYLNYLYKFTCVFSYLNLLTQQHKCQIIQKRFVLSESMRIIALSDLFCLLSDRVSLQEYLLMCNKCLYIYLLSYRKNENNARIIDRHSIILKWILWKCMQSKRNWFELSITWKAFGTYWKYSECKQCDSRQTCLVMIRVYQWNMDKSIDICKHYAKSLNVYGASIMWWLFQFNDVSIVTKVVNLFQPWIQSNDIKFYNKSLFLPKY